MKKILAIFLLFCGFMTPSISNGEHPSSVYYHRPSTTYDIPLSQRVLSANDFLNITSDTGTIIWDTFRISLVNLSNIPTKMGSFFCGLVGTFYDDYWYDNCSDRSSEILKTYKEINFIYSNSGDKKTFIHNILLDVPGLIVNLSEI